MYCEFDVRPSLLKFAPMRTSCLQEIRRGCQDANAVNARIRTVANLLRIYIFAYSLVMGVDLVGIQEFAHAFACSANLAQKIYIFSHGANVYANILREYGIRPSLLKFAPMRISYLHKIGTGCQDANAVNARICTVANLVRIYIFA